MSRSDLVPRVAAVLSAVAAAGTYTGAIYRVGSVLYLDTGTAVVPLTRVFGRATNSASQSVAQNTATQMTLNTAGAALGGITFSTSTGKFTVGTTGWYRVRAEYFCNDGAGSNTVGLGFSTAAAGGFVQYQPLPMLQGFQNGLMVSEASFNAGDVVFPWIYSAGRSMTFSAATASLELIG